MPIVRDIVYGSAGYGVDVLNLCARLKIDASALNDPGRRVDFETSCRSWELAISYTGDPLLGLHLGERSNPSILGLVGHLMQHSENLIDAFRQVSRHGRVATNMFDYGIKEKNSQVILTYEPAALWKQTFPQGARHATWQAMAGTLSVFRMLSGRTVLPLTAVLSHPLRGSSDEFARVFGVVPTRGSADQLVFDRSSLLVAIPNSDRSLFRVLEKALQANTGLSRKTLKGQLQALILDDFKGQAPPIQVMAARMNLTVRSLQRRLAAEEVSYRDLVEELRRQVARKLLKAGSHKVAEVATLLGYSDARSFRRAFKAWTSATPSSLRR